VLEVAFAEDQQPVGELGTGGEHEPLGVGVRAGTAGRIFSTVMPASANSASKAAVNWPARSRTR
jgi:hypothetical protein